MANMVVKMMSMVLEPDNASTVHCRSAATHVNDTGCGRPSKSSMTEMISCTRFPRPVSKCTECRVVIDGLCRVEIETLECVE